MPMHPDLLPKLSHNNDDMMINHDHTIEKEDDPKIDLKSSTADQIGSPSSVPSSATVPTPSLHSPHNFPNLKKEKVQSRRQQRKAKIPHPKDLKQPMKTLCHAIARGEPCPRVSGCQPCPWSHDIHSYLKEYPSELAGQCPNFQLFGKCPFGLLCQFRHDHTHTIDGNIYQSIHFEKITKMVTQGIKRTCEASHPNLKQYRVHFDNIQDPGTLSTSSPSSTINTFKNNLILTHRECPSIYLISYPSIDDIPSLTTPIYGLVDHTKPLIKEEHSNLRPTIIASSIDTSCEITETIDNLPSSITPNSTIHSTYTTDIITELTNTEGIIEPSPSSPKITTTTTTNSLHYNSLANEELSTTMDLLHNDTINNTITESFTSNHLIIDNSMSEYMTDSLHQIEMAHKQPPFLSIEKECGDYNGDQFSPILTSSSKIEATSNAATNDTEIKINEKETQLQSLLKTVNQSMMAWKNPYEVNYLSRILSRQLSSKSYPFVRSVLVEYQLKRNPPTILNHLSSSPFGEQPQYDDIKNSRPLVALQPPGFGSNSRLDFKDRLILAPLTTVGNLPFRRLCKRLGADITMGEMALSSSLLRGQASEWALIRRHESETCFGVQIASHHIDQCARTVELLNREMSVDFIDLNAGCPIDLMCDQGLGSALLSRLSRLQMLVTAMSQTSNVPITLKTRIGRDWEHPVALTHIAPVVHQWGASALTIHGRSRNDRYRHDANWQYIQSCADQCQIPLIGNGDIYNFEQANAYLASGKVTSLMIARGALIKPWIFTELQERRHWDISSQERLEILKEFIRNGLEHWGSDKAGVERTRYFLLQWMSFLWRYIPVGLLEHPAAYITSSTNPGYGRNDLEIWMRSPDICEWIRLTRMFLGTEPEHYNFEPTHKAGG